MFISHSLKPIKRISLPLSLGLLLAALIFSLFKVVLPSLGHMTHGFPAYYTASTLLIEGKLGPQAYDDAWFVRQVHTVIGQPIDEILTPTLPTASLIALPFSALPPLLARDSWIWFNLLLLLSGLGFLLATGYILNQYQTTWSFWLIFMAFAFIFPPVAANLFIGQSIILFFCLLSLALFGLAGHRDELAGLALGLTFVLKTVGGPLWLLLLIRRRWKALGWGIGTILIVVLSSLPWIGIDTWWAYVQAVQRVSGGTTMTVPAYQTTAGLFAHLFYFDPVWNPAPIDHRPALATLLPLLISLIAVTITLWLGRSSEHVADLFAALIPLSVVLLPVAEEHHFVILLIPIFILGDHLRHDFSLSVDWLLLGPALFLLLVPLPYASPVFSAGWLALLAYPRLYGAWLIWLIAVRRLRVGQLQVTAAVL
jgi:hypothetical protein